MEYLILKANWLLFFNNMCSIRNKIPFSIILVQWIYYFLYKIMSLFFSLTIGTSTKSSIEGGKYPCEKPLVREKSLTKV